MKVRELKHMICFGQLVRMYIAGTMPRRRVAPIIIDAGRTTLHDPRRLKIDWDSLMAKQAQRNLVEGPIENILVDTSSSMGRDDEVDDQLEKIAEDLITAPAATFTVARKKDGEIIGTYETIDAAQAVIDKAKAAKKAALVLV